MRRRRAAHSSRRRPATGRRLRSPRRSGRRRPPAGPAGSPGWPVMAARADQHAARERGCAIWPRRTSPSRRPRWSRGPKTIADLGAHARLPLLGACRGRSGPRWRRAARRRAGAAPPASAGAARGRCGPVRSRVRRPPPVHPAVRRRCAGGCAGPTPGPPRVSPAGAGELQVAAGPSRTPRPPAAAGVGRRRPAEAVRAIRLGALARPGCRPLRAPCAAGGGGPTLPKREAPPARPATALISRKGRSRKTAKGRAPRAGR